MFDDQTLDEDYKARQIRRVLCESYEEFTTYLASAIALTEMIPDEVNNQIRNAFTHLSRAHEAKLFGDFNREIERALGHIERANRDCLKAAIIGAREELDNILADAYLYYGFVTPAIEAARANVADKRQLAYRAEASGSKTLNDDLQEILVATLNLSKTIKQQFIEVGSKKVRIIRFAKRWSRPAWGILGVAIGALARPYTPAIINFLESLLG